MADNSPARYFFLPNFITCGIYTAMVDQQTAILIILILNMVIGVIGPILTASLQILKVIPELVYGLMERGQGGLMSKKLLIFEKVILCKAFNNDNKDIFYEIVLCFLSYIL